MAVRAPNLLLPGTGGFEAADDGAEGRLQLGADRHETAVLDIGRPDRALARIVLGLPAAGYLAFPKIRPYSPAQSPPGPFLAWAGPPFQGWTEKAL